MLAVLLFFADSAPPDLTNRDLPIAKNLAPGVWVCLLLISRGTFTLQNCMRCTALTKPCAAAGHHQATFCETKLRLPNQWSAQSNFQFSTAAILFSRPVLLPSVFCSVPLDTRTGFQTIG